MDIAKYTAEDFVMDPSFRRWVVNPDAETKIEWEELLSKNPHQYEAAEKAREIIFNLSIKSHQIDNKLISEIWEQIERNLDVETSFDYKVVPLDSKSTLGKKSSRAPVINLGFWWGVACFFIVCLTSLYLFGPVEEDENLVISEPKTYVERITPPGVKSNLMLSDGSKIILNSNSKLKFRKQFDLDKREVFLEGEAFFDVAEDSIRPFIVNVGQVNAVALGTSFNIKAYNTSNMDIALVSGKVLIEDSEGEKPSVLLVPGQMAQLGKETLQVTDFDKDLILSWTIKQILFKETPLDEAIFLLENWYGVKIHIFNRPKSKVTFSGKFEDETLKNVLYGLSYVAGFKFSIHQNDVNIKFNN
ncbi:MAG TPA: FecR domain-containing protein [Lunatimonas sp.]|nr:FecR domain-containing protein [Lunatimonas sp.]